MKRAPLIEMERHRIAGYPGERAGAFVLYFSPTATRLTIVASDDCGWEHVSVSTPSRCPNWREMEAVCRMFWDDEETVMQLHPPRSDWVNCHPFVLHLWKPTDGEIPRPPSWMVGPKLTGDER